MAHPTRRRQLLGKAAKRIRTLKGIKQDTVAQACGIHPAYLSNIEKGARQPSIELMVKIANALEVDIDEITYETVIVSLADEAVA